MFSRLRQIPESERAVGGSDQRAEAAGNARDADRMRTVHQSLDLASRRIGNDDGRPVAGCEFQSRELLGIRLRGHEFTSRGEDRLKDRWCPRSPSEAVDCPWPGAAAEKMTDVSDSSATGPRCETLSTPKQRKNLH